MSEREIRDPEGRMEHPNAAYEEKDIHLGWIVALIIATGCVFATAFVVDWFFFGFEQHSQTQVKESPYPLAPSGSPLPPPPRLEQVDRMAIQPGERYRDRMAEMERQLHASGPADEKGFVHIPIERAMHEIVEQLPVRKQPSDEALHAVHAGSSNSGRMLPGAPPWSEY